MLARPSKIVFLHVVLSPFIDPDDRATCLMNAIWLKSLAYRYICPSGSRTL